MFDFGFKYCYTYCCRLYKQIKNIYKIKTHIDIIYSNFDKININQIEKFESLKQIIFSCGSLYIKFFQWYISKLKSNIINTNTDTNANTNTKTTSTIITITITITYIQ